MNIVKIKWLPEADSDQEIAARLDKYFDWRKIFYLNDEILHLGKLQDLINAEEPVFIENQDMSPEKTICCKITSGDPWSGVIPRVIKSNHPRFGVGCRFDYGFMNVSLEDGYSIQYN